MKSIIIQIAQSKNEKEKQNLSITKILRFSLFQDIQGFPLISPLSAYFTSKL